MDCSYCGDSMAILIRFSILRFSQAIKGMVLRDSTLQPHGPRAVAGVSFCEKRLSSTNASHLPFGNKSSSLSEIGMFSGFGLMYSVWWQLSKFHCYLQGRFLCHYRLRLRSLLLLPSFYYTGLCCILRSSISPVFLVGYGPNRERLFVIFLWVRNARKQANRMDKYFHNYSSCDWLSLYKNHNNASS